VVRVLPADGRLQKIGHGGGGGSTDGQTDKTYPIFILSMRIW